MATEVLAELKSFQSGLNDKLTDITDRVDRMGKRMDTCEELVSRPVGTWSDGPAQVKSLSATVIESDEYKNFQRAGKGRVMWLLGKSFFEHEFKTTITSDALPAGAIVPQRAPAIVSPGVEPVRVRSLIPRVACTSGSVDYLRELLYTNAASPQVEGSAKSESALTFELESMGIKTLAHWIPASRQVLDDLPQLRSYLDQRLIDGLRDVEDAQLIAGDGTGQNLSGLITEGTAYNTSLTTTGDTAVDLINNALTQLEISKLRGTGIILHPRDWRRILKTKTNDPSAGLGPYVLPGPQVAAPAMLWGLPVATSTSMTQGQFIVLDARRVALFDRMDARVEISTEHADYWTKNLVAIRAEERLALVVFLAEAVVFGTLP